MVGFAIKDCSLATVATGRRAQTLGELRDILRDVHPGCIYHHFWGGLMRPEFFDREYTNDFAAWCHYGLHDGPLAERLAIIDPADFKDIEDLRQELIDVIEERLDETEMTMFTLADRQLHLTRSVIVVFDTHRRLAHPAELMSAVPELSVGSIFYHVVDARRRDPAGIDDFRGWLAGLGPEYRPLTDSLAEIDPYFESLVALRARLAATFAAYFGPLTPKGARGRNSGGRK